MCSSRFLLKLATILFAIRLSPKCFPVNFAKCSCFKFHKLPGALQKIHKKTPPLESLLLKKKALAQVFSCEFCEISKNTFSYRKSPVAASDKTNDPEPAILFAAKKHWAMGFLVNFIYKTPSRDCSWNLPKVIV